MKGSFANFLNNRPDLMCKHSRSEWCNNCVGKNVRLIQETLPDGSVTKGFYIKNI